MSSQLVNALTLALLHFVWQGAILTALVAVGFKLSAQSAKARYALACAVLFAMPMVVGITTVVELQSADTAQLQTFVREASQRPIHVTVQPAARSESVPAPTRLTPRSRTSPSQWLGAWILPLWLLGVALLCGYRAASWIAAQRLRRRAVCATTPEWQQQLNRLITQLRISRHVAMLESSLTDTPLTMGVLRPVILLPIGLLAGLPVEQIEFILLHELAHIRRHDYLVNLLQTAVESLLFYHPGVWWLSRRIRMEREYCCDDIVVAATDDVTAYARTLAELEQRRSVFNNTVLAATGGNLMFRIQRLLGRPAAAKGAMSGPLAIVLLLVSCAALFGWQSKSFTPAPQNPSQNNVAQVQTGSPQSAQNSAPGTPGQAGAPPGQPKPTSFFQAFHAHLWHVVLWFHQLIGIAPPTHTATIPTEVLKNPQAFAAGFRAEPEGRKLEERNTVELLKIQQQAAAQQLHEELEAPLAANVGGPQSAPVSQSRWTAKLELPKRAEMEAQLSRGQVPVVQAQFQPDPKPPTPESELERQLTALERTRASLERQLKGQLETPYQKWLNEEVYRIISDSERAAFQQLQTDEQRQAFIEQFWLRRDPTPDTSKNEFMEDYYRRLAYVNATFASGDLPGWRTDRGLVYIRFGPPDEIHGNARRLPGGAYEEFGQLVWHYNYVDGIRRDADVTFFNQDGTGFHLLYEHSGLTDWPFPPPK